MNSKATSAAKPMGAVRALDIPAMFRNWFISFFNAFMPLLVSFSPKTSSTHLTVHLVL